MGSVAIALPLRPRLPARALGRDQEPRADPARVAPRLVRHDRFRRRAGRAGRCRPGFRARGLATFAGERLRAAVEARTTTRARPLSLRLAIRAPSASTRSLAQTTSSATMV